MFSKRPKLHVPQLKSERQTSGFEIIEDEKFIDIASQSILQLTFNKQSLTEFWCSLGE
jgi:hypothetical protein